MSQLVRHRLSAGVAQAAARHGSRFLCGEVHGSVSPPIRALMSGRFWPCSPGEPRIQTRGQLLSCGICNATPDDSNVDLKSPAPAVARILSIQEEVPGVKRFMLSAQQQEFSFLPGQWVSMQSLPTQTCRPSRLNVQLTSLPLVVGETAWPGVLSSTVYSFGTTPSRSMLTADVLNGRLISSLRHLRELMLWGATASHLPRISCRQTERSSSSSSTAVILLRSGCTPGRLREMRCAVHSLPDSWI